MEPIIYLTFNGNCHEAMTRYADVLGGRTADVFRNADAPADSRMPGSGDQVMNMSLHLGSAILMASDSPDSFYQRPQGFSVMLPMPSEAEFERVWEALSEGSADIAMPPAETFWAERFAMFRDRFGTPWMLNYTGSKAQPQ